MALSADDKLLGEKVDNYCSSSEEEEDVDEKSAAVPEPELDQYKGYSTNTGPKGVINDWRRYKQLENEKKEEQEKEKLELMKKLSITCRTQEEDEAAKQREDLDRELEELEDDFMKEYRERRLMEMRKIFDNVPKFGKVLSLSKEQFIKEIDEEKPTVTICVHIYEEKDHACEAMNRCMACLALEYPTVKFCKMTASDGKLSRQFANNAVPALLIYKKGELIGNFITLTDEFGEDFFASDVESFLIEHGMLPDKLVGSTFHEQSSVRGNSQVEQDSDSDFDID